MDDNTLREKMRKRRAAMEMSLMSETGSVQSDDQNMSKRFASKSPRPSYDETTVMDVLNEDENTTEIQPLHSEDQAGEMLEELKTRRMQRQSEFGQGSWLAPSTSSKTLDQQDVEGSVQYLQRSELAEGDKDKQTNLNASIRERLRSKVRGIQSKPPTEEEVQDVPERKLRGLKDTSRPTRFDEPGVSTLVEEDEEYRDVDQDTYGSPRQRRKSLGLTRRRQRGIPSAEEAYHFFTGTLEIDESPPQEVPQSPGVEDIGTVEGGMQVEEEEEESFLLDDGQLIFYGKDPYISNAERLHVESELYFIPSVLQAAVSDKIPEGSIPRYLEEEGFYVGRPPAVSPANLNIMEHRILREMHENRLWFGEDALLRRLPDPLREKCSRPMMLALDELDPQLKTPWAKAEITCFDDRFIDRSGEKWYQIDIDVSTLTFMHHPLFSKEHVLQARLQDLYMNYCRRKKQSLSDHLTDKLTALKMALNQCCEGLDSQASTSTGKIKPRVDDLAKRIQDYKLQVRQTRKQRDAENITDRKLLKEILECWQDTKQLREQQGYINTPTKLVIFREKMEKEKEEVSYHSELEEELQERREQFEEEYVERMKEYKLQMREWKKRKKIKDRRNAEENNQERTELVYDDEDVKPERPPEFNQDEEYHKILENAEKARRKPGEPILTPELQASANVTALEQCPRTEQQRRKEVQKWHAFIKVLFNGKEVSRTLTKSLLSDFTIHFGEIHPVKILQWPESIKLQIHESSSFQSKLLAEVFIPIPEPSKLSGQVDLDAFEFSSNAEVVCQHDGVGSGITFAVRANNEGSCVPGQTLLTSGKAYSSASWGLDYEGRPLVPPQSPTTQPTPYSNMRKYDALAALGAAGMMDIHTLSQWINESNLDPNDPANADIMSLVKMAGSDGTDGGPKYFRLHQLEEEAQFVTEAELNNCKRFRILQLRNQMVSEFRNFKTVPLRDEDIPENVFEVYEKRIEGVQDEAEDEDDFGAHRAAVSKFLNKVRQQVTARSLVAKRQRDLRDMVIEDEVPDVGSLGFRIAQLLAPRRPLKPVRRERKTVGTQNLSVTNVRILVNVVRAFDVPVRLSQPQASAQETSSGSVPHQGEQASASSMFTTSSTYGGGNVPQNRPLGARTNPLGEPQVRPFVEVVFQGNFIRTTVADGPNPSWNEELTVPFQPPNDDYTPANLQTINDVIYLNVFDEVIVDILQDEQQRATNIHQRLERHWLGSIELPFSTVYFNTKVDGTFKINTPAVLLGYHHNNSRGQGAPDIGIGARDQTFLSLFVTIEPPLQPSQPLAEKFETSENDRLIHNAHFWQAEIKKKFPKREYKVLATDLNGKKVFLTRYIREQNMPSDFGIDPSNPPPNAMDIACRYVSLIPYISDSVAFPDLCDLWSTSDQFLQMLAGDEEEHAVLLCNYFLWLGKKAWLVIGTGIPEGSTTYVLSFAQGIYLLWNAHTGERFTVYDAYCPLQNIACLINSENIWANMQQSGQAYRMSFDLSNTKLWKPFFTKTYPNPGLSSVQKPMLDYTRTDPQYVSELQDKIERLLRDKIMAWRSRYVTRWNRYCCQSFRDLLATMEHEFQKRAAQDHKAQLNQILSSYKLSGFPLHMAFTDINPVIDAVHSTGVHLTEDPNVEFALAVHIHPYPSNVLSLWVYVGTLTRRIRYY